MHALVLVFTSRRVLWLHSVYACLASPLLAAPAPVADGGEVSPSGGGAVVVGIGVVEFGLAIVEVGLR